VFYFTCSHVWNWNKIISAAERVVKLQQNYLSSVERVGKYLWAAITLWNNFEVISGKLPRAKIELFQSDVDECWNNFKSIIIFAMEIDSLVCLQFRFGGTISFIGAPLRFGEARKSMAYSAYLRFRFGNWRSTSPLSFLKSHRQSE